jgi:hypothetical protein
MMIYICIMRAVQIIYTVLPSCCLFATGIKKGEAEGYKCHAETMMSTKS